MKKYSDKTIYDAVDRILCYAMCVDYKHWISKGQEPTANPNYNSGCPYDKPGQLVASFLKNYPELAQSLSKHWQRRVV